MDFLFVILILAIFLLPSLLMMRSQKKRQRKVEEMQSSISPGDRIVNVAGFHATVVEHNGESLLVEIAPNVVVTMETAGVMKRVEESPAEQPTQHHAEGHTAEPVNEHQPGEDGNNR